MAKRGLVWVGKKSLTETVVALAAAVKHIFGQKFATRVGSQKKRRAKVVLGKNNLGLGGGGFTLQFGENMRKEGAGRKEATVG